MLFRQISDRVKRNEEEEMTVRTAIVKSGRVCFDWELAADWTAQRN